MEGGMICLCHYGGVLKNENGVFKYTGGEAKPRHIGKGISFDHFVHMMEELCANDKNKTEILMELLVCGVSVKVKDDYDYEAMFSLYHTNPQHPLQISITKHNKTGSTTEKNNTTGNTNKLPHNYGNIVKDADSPIPQASTDELLRHLRSGVLLNQKRKKFWIDNSGNNCFTLFPKDLSITWVDDRRYWQWVSMSGIVSNGVVEIPELLQVWWLEVIGRFDTSNLTPETTYEIVMEVMLKYDASGWALPVEIKLEHPDGQPQVHKENLQHKPKGQWTELQVGGFHTSRKTGTMEIRMFGCEAEAKKGLLIRGLTIRPKK